MSDTINEKFKKNQENATLIAEKLETYGIKTTEAKATILAIIGALCDFIPIVETCHYTNAQDLRRRFPKTCEQDYKQSISDGKYICSLLGWDSNDENTAEDFFKQVYDPATDGYSVGNIEPDDAKKYYGAGLIHIIGRREYLRFSKLVDSAYKDVLIAGAPSLIKNLDACINVAALVFLQKMDGVPPTAHPNYFYEASRKFLFTEEQKAKGLTLYEHFYGAFTPEHFDNSTLRDSFSQIYGTLDSICDETETLSNDNRGFKDPNNAFPEKTKINEPTTNRLARGDIRRSAFSLKKSQRRLGIKTSVNGITWNQPYSGYNAKYPYNHVIESASGHVIEMDDTHGAERLHMYHKSGTFMEIDHAGTKVNRIVGDSYSILDRNGFIVIDGDCNVTVEGNVRVYCKTNANICVEGNTELQCKSGLNVGVAGDFNLSAGGDIKMYANGTFSLESKNNGHIKAENNLYISANNELHETAVSKKLFNCEGTYDAHIKGSSNVLYYGNNFAKTIGEKSDFVVQKWNDLCLGERVSTSIAGTKIVSSTHTTIMGSGQLNLFGGTIEEYSTANTVLYSKGITTVHSVANCLLSSDASLNVMGAAQLGLFATGCLIQNSDGLMNITAENINLGSKAITNIYGGTVLNLASTKITNIDGKPLNQNMGFALESSAAAYTNASATALAIKPSLLSERATQTSFVNTVGKLMSIPSMSGNADEPEKAIKALELAMKFPESGVVSNPNLPPLPSTQFADENETIHDEAISSDAALDVMKQEGQLSGIGGGITTNAFSDNNTKNDSARVDLTAEQIAQIESKGKFPDSYKLSEHCTLGFMRHGHPFGTNVKQLKDGTTVTITQEDAIKNLTMLCTNLFEKVIDYMPGGWEGLKHGRWYLTSGWRDVTSNPGVSSGCSQHLKGQAIDIQIAGKDRHQHWEVAVNMAKELDYDQLLFEMRPGTVWIHISYAGKDNRHVIHTLYNDRICNSNAIVERGDLR